jgi:hypothetical protein
VRLRAGVLKTVVYETVAKLGGDSFGRSGLDFRMDNNQRRAVASRVLPDDFL